MLCDDRRAALALVFASKLEPPSITIGFVTCRLASIVSTGFIPTAFFARASEYITQQATRNSRILPQKLFGPFRGLSQEDREK